MKFYRWIVTYVKLFKTGTLEGMKVECEIGYPSEELAIAMVSFLKTNAEGLDALTNNLFTVIAADYREEVTNEV